MFPDGVGVRWERKERAKVKASWARLQGADAYRVKGDTHTEHKTKRQSNVDGV